MAAYQNANYKIHSTTCDKKNKHTTKHFTQTNKKSQCTMCMVQTFFVD